MKMLFKAYLIVLIIGSNNSISASDDDTARIDRMLHANADRALKEYEAQGYIVDDPLVTGYLESLLYKVFPDRKDELHVHLVRDRDPNAFAMPNGHLLVTEGFISIMRSEGQLLDVLGHEGGHYLEHHSREKLERLRDVGKWYRKGVNRMRWWDILRSRTMYGREQELEADRYGVQALLREGYSLNDAASTWLLFNAFETAMRDREAPDDLMKVLVTHPSNQERIDVYREIARESGSDGSGQTGIENYNTLTQGVTRRVAERWRQLMQDRVLRLLVTDPSATARLGKDYYLMVAELFRLSGSADERKRVGEILQSALATSPNDPRVYEALARDAYSNGIPEEASRWLSRYLDVAAATDPFRPLVRQLVKPAQLEGYSSMAAKASASTFSSRNLHFPLTFSLDSRWRVDALDGAEGFRASVDGHMLNSVRVQVKPVEEEYRYYLRKPPAAITLLDLGDLVRGGILYSGDQAEVLETRLVEVAGQPAFEITYRTVTGKGLAYLHKYAGFVHQGNFYEVSYSAPVLLYFDKEYSGYQQVMATLDVD